MQNDSIITTNLKDITLSSQFLTLTTPNGELEIDIKKLLKEPVNSDSAYFNATSISKMYGTAPAQIFRTDNWKEYVQIMEEEVNSNYAFDAHLKMIKTVRGKHHSGSWLHSKLIIEFIRRLDVKLAVKMDLFIQDLIIHSNEIKIERDNTKILFHGLTQTLQDIYIPNQTSDNAKKFAFSSISTLVNMIVLGCKASKYANDNNIEIEGSKSIRDYLSKSQLDEIKTIEGNVNGIIKYGKVYEYQDIKEELLR